MLIISGFECGSEQRSAFSHVSSEEMSSFWCSFAVWPWGVVMLKLPDHSRAVLGMQV